MAEDKDISEVIEEEAAALEAAAESELPEETPDETPETPEEEVAETETPETPEAPEVKAEEPETPPADAMQAPEHWAEDIRQAFEKADPETQQVWLNQQKDFQRGFNSVSQEAAELRRYQQEHIGVQNILSQVTPAWQAQGMTPEQGLGQLVQLGMAYASNPQQTLIHLAEMAGLDINTLGQEAPYRTSDDIARDNRMQQLEQRIQQQDQYRQQEAQRKLESDINAFQAETDAHGNLAHPYFEEHMDDIAALFRSGFQGDLKAAYEQVIWTNPETRAKLMSGVPSTPRAQTDEQRIAAAKKAQAASNQRVKHSRPAPDMKTDLDDLSVDDLVARVAAQMEANG
jgi:hypothetical protein